MSKIAKSIIDIIGNTPLLCVSRFTKQYGGDAVILAKLERQNPAGSVKDRAAYAMLRAARASGALKENGVIIEPTSGNTGIGLAAIARVMGHRVILTMPDTMSMERRSLLLAYGAELILTEGARGMDGAIARARELLAEMPGSFMPSQFDNPQNPLAHFETTGPEIYADTDGKIDIFVAGVGTGGTLSGVSRYLKEQNPAIVTVAVEPLSSPLLSGGKAGGHKIQGIGANFIPDNFDKSYCDEVIAVSNEDAMLTARALAQTEGLLCGISSGAALHAALELAKRAENKGKTIAVIFPDTGERYLSTGVFE